MVKELSNEYHREIVNLFKSHAETRRSKQGNDYIGSGKLLYPINSPSSRILIKEWLKSKPNLTFREYTDLLDSLALGESHNEFQVIGRLLEYRPKLRRLLPPDSLNLWLSYAEGWAEVDGICQSNFSFAEMLSHWEDWRKAIEAFLHSENVHKRRASLVLLTGPVRNSDDKRLSELAFRNIDELKHEKDILITKAISWLLRELITNHREEVREYIEKNDDALPRIAVRETVNKLNYGRKSGK